MRLIPWWYVCLTFTFLIPASVGFTVGAVSADGFVRLPLALSGLAFTSLSVAAFIALVLPKRRRTPAPDLDRSVTIKAPAALVTCTVLGLAAMTLAGVLWGTALALQPAVLDSPRLMFFAVLIGVAALASLPEWWRLCTGRLHRWQVILGPDDFTYRGYKHDVTIPWERIRGAVTQKRKPAGVRVERKGTKPGVVIPITAFRIPAGQFIDEINKRRR
ncbi:hypothetical protein [Nocardioides limicola]|uniref:hypothetical protein n=1 Tax=Nocardioides limicola TaxID=2803368 RepID=UPI00193B061D|nr:hypothetical protein [Nocardioides sp. DJM-14]